MADPGSQTRPDRPETGNLKPSDGYRQKVSHPAILIHRVEDEDPEDRDLLDELNLSTLGISRMAAPVDGDTLRPVASAKVKVGGDGRDQGGTTEEEEDEDRLNSQDLFTRDEGRLYSISPPHTNRSKKLLKSKQMSWTKEEKEKQRKAMKIAARRAAKLSCDWVDHSDSDGSGDGRKTKRGEVKLRMMSRQYDRDSKMQPDEFSCRTPPTAIQVTPGATYKSLPTVKGNSQSLGRRQLSNSSTECPPDRKDFHKTLSLLINMGNKAVKEHGRADTRPDECRVGRQLSAEEEQWQIRVNDLIWLELQAWHAGKTVDEYDVELTQKREEATKFLGSLLEFEVEPYDFCGTKIPLMLHDPFDMRERYIVTLHSIVRQLDVVIHNLDAALSLFPTSKALVQYYEICGRPEFQTRMEALFVWHNNARGIMQHIRQMGLAVGVHRMPKVKWPLVEKDSDVTDCSSGCVAVGDRLGFRRASGSLASGDEMASTATLMGLCDELAADSEGDGSGDDKLLVGGGEGGARDEAETFDGDAVCTEAGCVKRPLALRSQPGCSVSFQIDTPPRSESPEPGTASTPVPNGPSSEPGASTAFSCSDSAADSLARLRAPSSSSAPQDLGHSHSVMNSSFVSVDLGSYRTAFYRPFVDKSLRKMSFNLMTEHFRSLLKKTLLKGKHCIESLECSHPISRQSSAVNSMGNHLSPPPPDILEELMDSMEADGTKMRHGLYHEHFKAMHLPSLKPAFIFLARIPLDMIHESLRLKMEHRVEKPSLLSIKQIVDECREILRAAVYYKQSYQYVTTPVFTALQPWEDKFESYLEEFNNDVQTMLETYFDYILQWIIKLQRQRTITIVLKNILEEQWAFCKEICPKIAGGMVNAGKKFCNMARSLIESIQRSIENQTDEALHHTYYPPEEPDSDASSMTSLSANGGPTYSDADVCTNSHYRLFILKTCRDIKQIFQETRERAAKTLGFAKMMRKDLEIASDFQVVIDHSAFLDQLKENYIKLNTTHVANYLMFVPKSLSHYGDVILNLLDAMCGQEDRSDGEGPADGYLLMVRCDNVQKCRWYGDDMLVEPTADTAISLSHIEVEDLLVVVTHSSNLYRQRKHFQDTVGKSVVLVNEQTSWHLSISESLTELKASSIELGEKVRRAIKEVDNKLSELDLSSLDEMEVLNMTTLYRETMHQSYHFGFEYLQELTRLVTSQGDLRQRLNTCLINFAYQWMGFVEAKCERGRGTRPRWATVGMEFLITACEPRIIAHLEQEQFDSLKATINKCITHIIGDKTSVPTTPAMRASPDIFHRKGPLRGYSCPANGLLDFGKAPRVASFRSTTSDPTTPYESRGSTYFSKIDNFPRMRLSAPGATFGSFEDEPISANVTSPRLLEDQSQDTPFAPPEPLERVRASVRKLEESRAQMLREKRVIGKVTDRTTSIDFHVNIRRVNFKWQRGIKIGEGQFGKVYSAINVDTGEFMAMKEIRFQPNDLQTIKEIADEVKIFEPIHHESLVKYFGVELHRDEMFIFMQYCDEGTLEEAAKVGLTETMIRKYLFELLRAVEVLHSHNIMHRDIKGANIFLMSQGPLKLGDFGCSVKLKEHMTMPGEINNFVGTAAFMAPEVINQKAVNNRGQGRAADIWSIGCVVVEMATGKRPWFDLENRFQIMFKVGMGNIPAIPDSLSDEGKDFLCHCLVADPQERWTATGLLDHMFCKFQA